MLRRAILLLICACIACAGSKPSSEDQGKPLYTAYNLWYEKPDSMSSINYKKGTIIPAGTRVESVSARGDEIKFRRAGMDRTFIIEFSSKYHPEVSITEFRDRLFTTKQLQSLTSGFSERELECVKEGVIKPGISKKAVLVAYGYPPEHVTASTKENEWTYWRDRFRKIVVKFDERGITK